MLKAYTIVSFYIAFIFLETNVNLLGKTVAKKLIFTISMQLYI